jgi:hypothetical protein
MERQGCMLHGLHLLIAVDLMRNPLMRPIVMLVTKLKEIFRALTYKYDKLEEIHNQYRTNEELQALVDLAASVSKYL